MGARSARCARSSRRQPPWAAGLSPRRPDLRPADSLPAGRRRWWPGKAKSPGTVAGTRAPSCQTVKMFRCPAAVSTPTPAEVPAPDPPLRAERLHRPHRHIRRRISQSVVVRVQVDRRAEGVYRHLIRSPLEPVGVAAAVGVQSDRVQQAQDRCVVILGRQVVPVPVLDDGPRPDHQVGEDRPQLGAAELVAGDPAHDGARLPGEAHRVGQLDGGEVGALPGLARPRGVGRVAGVAVGRQQFVPAVGDGCAHCLRTPSAPLGDSTTRTMPAASRADCRLCTPSAR